MRSLQTEHKELLKQQAEEISRLAEEHAAALAAQRKELAVKAEQAEDRLMMLLDQERVEAKAHSKKLASDLDKMAQKSQSACEAMVALESTVKELTRQNDKVESDLAHRWTSAQVSKQAWKIGRPKQYLSSENPALIKKSTS